MSEQLLLLIGIAIRIAVSYWNSYWGPSFGAEYDAASFHREATAYQAGVDDFQFGAGHPYALALSWLYACARPSLFIGCSASVVAWYCSGQILMTILKYLNIPAPNRRSVVGIYALLPSSIMYTSITLREPYQLLMINAMAWLLICAINGSIIKRILSVVSSVLFSLMLTMLHGAFAPISAMFVSMIAWFGLEGVGRGKKIAMVLVIISVVLVCVLLFLSTSNYKLEDGVIQAVLDYQRAGLAEDARAHYKSQVLPEPELFAVIGLLIESFFQYLLEPMPWKVGVEADIVLLVENLVRAYMICRVILSWGVVRIQMKALFVIYILAEFVWSLGTVNWGTAVRHHLPMTGILLLVWASVWTKSEFPK